MTTTLSPRKRMEMALDVLTPERVTELAIRMNLPTKGNAAKLRKAIQGSGRLSEERLLHFLSVFELQDLCRKRGVSAQGRDATVLRARLHGEDPSPARAIFAATVPDEEIESVVARHRRFRIGRFVAGIRHSIGSLCWSAVGGGVAAALTLIVSDDPETLREFGIGGAVVCLFLRWRGYGRFRSLLLFGGGIIAATLYYHSQGRFDPQYVTHSRLAMMWGSALAFGTIFGIAEEIGCDMRR